MFRKKVELNKNIILPKHIGIIMDGNGRWAKKRSLPRYAGHSVGAKTFKTIARYCNKIGIEYLTVYAFSTENWIRPKKEVDTIIKLLEDYLDDSKNYTKENIKVKFIGDITVFDESIKQKIIDAENNSKNATGLNLNIAINYGGKAEIVNAIKLISHDILFNNLTIDKINEKLVNTYLYTSNQPDVDLIIRPSGENRLSNFLIWQSAYAEYIFMDILWPDFKEKHLIKALNEFSNRNRRFGGV